MDDLYESMLEVDNEYREYYREESEHQRTTNPPSNKEAVYCTDCNSDFMGCNCPDTMPF